MHDEEDTTAGAVSATSTPDDERRLPEIRRLLPNPLVSGDAPMAPRYLSGIFDEEGGFHFNGTADLSTLLRDTVVAIRRFVGHVQTMGSRTGDRTLLITGRDKRVVRCLWEDMCLLSQSVVPSNDRYWDWDTINGNESTLVKMGRLREGRGVDSFPATISTLTSKASSVCTVTDLDAGLIPAEAIEQLLRIADQLSVEAALVSQPVIPACAESPAPSPVAISKRSQGRDATSPKCPREIDPLTLDVIIWDQEWAEFKAGPDRVAKVNREDVRPQVWFRLLEFAAGDGSLDRPPTIYAKRRRTPRGDDAESDHGGVAASEPLPKRQEAVNARRHGEAWRQGIVRLNTALRQKLNLDGAAFFLQGKAYRSRFKSMRRSWSSGSEPLEDVRLNNPHRSI